MLCRYMSVLHGAMSMSAFPLKGANGAPNAAAFRRSPFVPTRGGGQLRKSLCSLITGT